MAAAHQNEGGFRHLVTLQRPVHSTNDNGIPVSRWYTLGSYHMSKRGLTGREFFDAAAAKMEAIEIFYARRGILITSDMRLLLKGKSRSKDKVYNIYSVRDVEVDGLLRQEIRARRTEVQR